MVVEAYHDAQEQQQTSSESSASQQATPMVDWKDVLQRAKSMKHIQRIDEYQVQGLKKGDDRASATIVSSGSSSKPSTVGSSINASTSSSVHRRRPAAAYPSIDLSTAMIAGRNVAFMPDAAAHDDDHIVAPEYPSSPAVGSSKITPIPKGREWSLGLGMAPASAPATTTTTLSSSTASSSTSTADDDDDDDDDDDGWDAFFLSASTSAQGEPHREELKRSAFDRVLKSLRYFLGSRAEGMNKTDQTNVLWFRDHAGLTKAASRAPHRPGPLAPHDLPSSSTTTTASSSSSTQQRESCWFLTDPEACVAEWQEAAWEEAMYGGSRMTLRAWYKMTLTNAFLHHLLLSRAISPSLETSLYESLIRTARASRRRLRQYRSAIGVLELLEQNETGWQAVARGAWMGSDEASAKKEPMETLETPSAAPAIQQKDDEAIIAYKDDIVYGDDDQEDMKARAAAWACVEVKDREEPYSSATDKLAAASIRVEDYVVSGGDQAKEFKITSADVFDKAEIETYGLSDAEKAFLRTQPSTTSQLHVVLALQQVSATQNPISLLTASPANPTCLWDAYTVGSGTGASSNENERQARFSRVLEGMLGLIVTAKLSVIKGKDREDCFVVVKEVEGVLQGKLAEAPVRRE